MRVLLLFLAMLILTDRVCAAELPLAGCESLTTEQERGRKYIDYNDASSAEKIRMVESYHFTPDVENLVKGSTGSVASDIAFVLRGIPNHYRALSAMGRWQLKHKLSAAETAKVLSADCYFQRAISFRGGDPKLRVVYAVYLHQAKRLDEAAHEYSVAERLGDTSPEFYYNYGLLLIDLGRMADAQECAEKAYAMGYPLPGLRNKLLSVQGGNVGEHR